MDFSGPLLDTNAHTNYWEGIVVDRSEWPRTDTPISDDKELNNWGYRVKVRIHGLHPTDTKILPDSKLPWIELPANPFGSGHRATGITPGVTQGSIVYGIYAVPALKKQPIILGVKHNNEQTELSKKPQGGFDPRSGFSATDTVPGYAVPLAEGNPLEGIAFGNYWNQSDAGKMEEYSFGLDSPNPCVASPLSKIQIEIKQLIAKIEKVQRQLKVWKDAAQGWIAEKQAFINKLIEDAAKKVAEGIRWIFEQVRKRVMEFTQDKMKKLYFLINPADRDKAKKAQDKIVELITCLFNKLINGLLGIVLGLLKNAIGKFINVPKCVTENIISNLLGNLLGAIGGAIDKLLSSVSDLIGGAISVADGILGLLKGLLGFFSCDDENECPETTEFHLWDGGKPKITFDLDSIFNQAKDIAAKAVSVVDPDNFTFDFAGMFGDFASGINGCFTGPLFCGPPTVEFFGGGGSGASGNAIVSAAGEILGVDIISPGYGYTKPPFVNIVDACGKGKGAVARAVIGKRRGGTGTGSGTGGSGNPGGGSGSGSSGGSSSGGNSAAGGGNIIFSAPSNNTSKQGRVATFYVYLRVRPSSIVTIRLTNSNSSQANLSTNTLTFRPDNWENRQTVYVTGLNDNAPGNVNYYIEGISSSLDISFNNKRNVVNLVNEDTINSNPVPALEPSPNADDVLTSPGGEVIDPEDSGVIQVVIEESGFGYISSPDGDLGGDGRIWATADQTIIRHADGSYDLPYDEDETLPELQDGDTVSYPEDRRRFSNLGGEVQGFPTNGSGDYPILLYLCDIRIERSGINYSPNDKIVIEPDTNGAILEPVWGPFGVLDKINIINSGIGFTERPTIYIESETGYNASIIPIMCVNRIGDDTVGEIPQNITDDLIVKVVDCVGRF